MPASSRRGPLRVLDPSNIMAMRSCDAGGFTGSVGRRCTRANPIAPVATGSPASVTRSTLASPSGDPAAKWCFGS